MLFRALSTNDFSRIEEYLHKNKIRLLICDLNGVLDNYYVHKEQLIKSILGETLSKSLFADIMIAIERDYMSDRSSTIESSITRFLREKGINLEQTQQNRNRKTIDDLSITADAKVFLDNLSVDIVIYTSMPRSRATQLFTNTQPSLFCREDSDGQKPSVNDIRALMRKYRRSPNETCVVGDGLIDDLMPASLLGTHTLLTSPYARRLVSSQNNT